MRIAASEKSEEGPTVGRQYIPICQRHVRSDLNLVNMMPNPNI